MGPMPHIFMGSATISKIRRAVDNLALGIIKVRSGDLETYGGEAQERGGGELYYGDFKKNLERQGIGFA